LRLTEGCELSRRANLQYFLVNKGGKCDSVMDIHIVSKMFERRCSLEVAVCKNLSFSNFVASEVANVHTKTAPCDELGESKLWNGI
jgi:hypothetical protein